MRNKFKEIDIKNCIYYFFSRLHDQHRKSWSKWNQDKWKVKQKYCYLPDWICVNQRP